MKRALLLFLILITVPSTVAAQENTLRVSPIRSTHSAQPGSVVRATITLENTSNKPITVSVLPKDFEASKELDGQLSIIQNGSSVYGISNWFAEANLDKKLTIPANQKVDYEAVFRVPFGVSPKTYFGMVTFNQAAGSSVNSPVFITVGNPETKLSFESLEFGNSQDATKPHGIFTAIIKNTSDGLSSPVFVLRITDEQGKVVSEQTQGSAGSILPNTSRKYIFAPQSKLPNKLLTVTLSSTDQNGTTADKSIQLDRTTPNSSGTIVEEINPNDYTLLLTGAATAFLVGLLLILFLRTKKHQK